MYCPLGNLGVNRRSILNKEIGVNKRSSNDSTQGRDYRIVLVNAALNLRFTEVMTLISYTLINVT